MSTGDVAVWDGRYCSPGYQSYGPLRLEKTRVNSRRSASTTRHNEDQYSLVIRQESSQQSSRITQTRGTERERERQRERHFSVENGWGQGGTG